MKTSIENGKKLSDLTVHGLSARSLRWSYWYIAHKLFLKKLLAIFLSVVAIFCWSFAVFQIVRMYVFEADFFEKTQMAIMAPRVDFEAYREKYYPKAPIPLEVVVISTGANHYDFLAKVKNPNKDWYIKSLTYEFLFQGGATLPLTAYILPEKERYLTHLGYISEGRVDSPSIRITGIQWKKIQALGIRDFSSYEKERFQISIENPTYISSQTLGISEKTPIARGSFRATNLSNYSFWNMGFLVFLTQNKKIISAEYTTSGIFPSFLSHDLEVSWFERLPLFGNLEIIPEINILDPTVFMDF